ncbi:hypothetical protein GGR57DRAFT_335789 [Xylariaceae sp. FL1272]|nr:hypothetical protein GGR57DRAFT_335789 [Xylariaceae sp. FL1272]
MELVKILTIFMLATQSNAYHSLTAYEFTEMECKGHTVKAWIDAKHVQIPMNNKTQSVALSLPNKGLLRWYGFAEATEDGTACYGDIVTRLNATCFDLTAMTAVGKPKVNCIRHCTMLGSKKHETSCASFGVIE